MSQFLWVRNLGGVCWLHLGISHEVVWLFQPGLQACEGLSWKFPFQDDSPVDGELVQAIWLSPRFLYHLIVPKTWQLISPRVSNSRERPRWKLQCLSNLVLKSLIVTSKIYHLSYKPVTVQCGKILHQG